MDRRSLMRSGLAALGLSLVPTVPALTRTVASYVSPAETMDRLANMRLAELAPFVVGYPEKAEGIYLGFFKFNVEKLRREGISVDWYYGTICGPSTNRVSIVDTLHWKVGDLPYQQLTDPKYGLEPLPTSTKFGWICREDQGYRTGFRNR